jgi:hypothetical protein
MGSETNQQGRRNKKSGMSKSTFYRRYRELLKNDSVS